MTGGAGHTGAFFVRQFLADDPANQAVCLVRPGTRRAPLAGLDPARLRLVTGDVRDEKAVATSSAGCDAILHLAHQNLCPNVAGAARAAGVRRVFFVTTTGVFSRFNELSEGYRRIEEQIRASPLTWTILRPSMIYGTERDLNMHKLLLFLDRSPVFPIFGDGMSLMQPVHVEDLAHGLLLAVRNAGKTERLEYNVVGRFPQTYKEIVREVADALGKTIHFAHLPARPSAWAAAVAERVLGPRSPMTVEQVKRLSEDKCFSWSAARALGYDPRPFRAGIRAEARELREKGLLPPAISQP